MNEYNVDNRQIAAWESEDAGQQIPLLDYLQLLWFRKKMIIAITLFAAVIGYIQVSEIKNVYTATATMLVGVAKTNVINIESVLSMQGQNFDSSAEVEVLQSRSLAEKVIERLNLLDYPEFNPWLRKPEKRFFDFLKYLDPRRWIPASWKRSAREAMGQETESAPPVTPSAEEQEAQKRRQQMITATNIFLSKLRINNSEWNKVIDISFTSLDPKMAARVANEVPEAYIVDQLEARFEATEKANSWLVVQLEELEEEVLESERAVEIYRDQHGLTGGDGRTVMDEQLSELNSQLIIARAERAELEARLAQLRRLLQGGEQGVETSSEVMSSTLIQQLRTQEAQALSRQSELSVEYGPKHPRMLQVEAEIAEIRGRIRDEVGRILVSLENEVDFARTRVNSLQNSLREAQGETSEQNKEAIQLRALQREAAANRALYETFLNRFKETSTTQGMETSDARVVSYAEVPGWPSYPNRKKMLIQYVVVGFIAACGLVLLLALMNPGMMSPEQVQKTLGEFVIGLIPIGPTKSPPHDYVLERPNSGLVEALNTLKFSLALSDPDHPVKAVQVTSSVPEEGKTTLALALARVVASS